jgi:hypothetical protein
VRRSLAPTGEAMAALLESAGPEHQDGYDGHDDGHDDGPGAGYDNGPGAGRRLVLATGPDAVTAAVTDLLQAGRERFMHVCFTGRRELHQLAQLRPAGRIAFIARLLDQELAQGEDRLQTLRPAPDLLAQYTAELERLRPELAAATAEAQRLHEDWSQKRQDVDTRLAAYRRRLDELKQQIGRLSEGGSAASCPTCDRPLGDDADRLIERLDDEYYIAAQDVKWLAQRERQLAHKPPDLIAAETRRGQLRAAVDDRTSRAARCEQAMQELWTVASDRQRAERLGTQHRTGAAPAAAPGGDRTLSAALLRALAERAGAAVARITDGHYDAITLDDAGRVHALVGGEPTPVVSGSDEDLIAFALRLATMQLIQQQERGPGLLLLDMPFGGMDELRQQRGMEMLAELNGTFPQIIMTTLTDLAPDVRNGPIRLRDVASKNARGADPAGGQPRS